MVGVSRSKSSYYKYRSVYRLLAAYVRERCRRADIPFRELDKRFLAGFHQYIARESPHKKNTAWVYMIAFKHILMLARSGSCSTPSCSVASRAFPTSTSAN